jgi:hypothetical protein
MRRTLLTAVATLTALAVLLVPGAAQDAPAPARPAEAKAPADHVVLVSIDGLRPEFYLDRTWPAPTVQHMAAEGAHAVAVRSVFPSVTYPSHTTMITGARPARHGIFYNTPFEPAGESGRWYWEAAAIRSPTLWDAVKAAGRECAAVSWPVSVGAPIARNVPEVWALDDGGDPLKAVRDATTPPELWAELEREATGRITPDRFGLEQLSRDDLAGEMAAHLLERYKPALLAVHLIEADHFQHEQGREGTMVRRAVGVVDRAVGKLLDAAERAGIAGRTVFVVTGDHGFVDIHTRVRPNVWLARAGLLESTKERGAWRAAWHTGGASAFLHLRDAADSAALHRVRAALAALPAGTQRLFRVLEREELARLGADPSAALALAPVPGVTFNGGVAGPDVDAADGGTHGYLCDFPEIHTGLVAFGPAIRKGAVVPQMALEDVAPLIARLLGIEFTAPDGVAPLGVLAR